MFYVVKPLTRFGPPITHAYFVLCSQFSKCVTISSTVVRLAPVVVQWSYQSWQREHCVLPILETNSNGDQGQITHRLPQLLFPNMLHPLSQKSPNFSKCLNILCIFSLFKHLHLKGLILCRLF